MSNQACHVKGWRAAYAERGNSRLRFFSEGAGDTPHSHLRFRALTATGSSRTHVVQRYVTQLETSIAPHVIDGARAPALWGAVNQFAGVSFLR